jgi:hypothetical protein
MIGMDKAVTGEETSKKLQWLSISTAVVVGAFFIANLVRLAYNALCVP